MLTHVILYQNNCFGLYVCLSMFLSQGLCQEFKLTGFEFSIFSWRALLNSFTCFGTSFILLGFGLSMSMDGMNDLEIVSYILFGVINYLIYPTLPSLIGYSLSKSEHIWYNCITKCSFMPCISLFCFVVGYSLMAFDLDYFKTSN